MDTALRRGLGAEFLGTFAVVYFSAGAVCVNYLTTTGAQPISSALHAQQPGLLGIALAQGLALAAALAVTVRVSGGFLNPAITLMLWVFNRLDSKRTSLFLAAQLAGAILAGGCLRFTIADGVLQEARMGTPHLNYATFGSNIGAGTIVTGASVEFLLTFFLVFAIFGSSRSGIGPEQAALPAGLMLAAGTIVAGPLTGAAANPARWFGTVLWEQLLPAPANPWGDTFVYLAGPILGALAAGLVLYRILFMETPETNQPKPVAGTVPIKQTAGLAKKK
jgi:MIP family channel proteins